MKNAFTLLCILPEKKIVLADWSDIGYPVKAERELAACLLSVYQYDNGNRVPLPVEQWEFAKKSYLFNVDAQISFYLIFKIVKKIVKMKKGLYIYSGSIDCLQIDENLKLNQNIKIGKSSSDATIWAASCAQNGSKLVGFAPGDSPIDTFYLGWFPLQDPMAKFLVHRWHLWNPEQDGPFVPRGPSPTVSSVEITFYGEENESLGLYIGEAFQSFLSPEWLRNLLGKGAVIARLSRYSLQDWFYSGSVSDLEILYP
jgi:hypothetical protein